MVSVVTFLVLHAVVDENLLAIREFAVVSWWAGGAPWLMARGRPGARAAWQMLRHLRQTAGLISASILPTVCRSLEA